MVQRRRRTVFILVLLLVLGGGGYVTAVALAPLPELQSTLTVEAQTQLEADTTGAAEAATAQSLPTALAWADGEQIWANDDGSYPLASLTKLVTVLVCLEAEPLEPGADGPVHVWSAADRQQQLEYQARLGIIYPIPIGTEVTTRQLLLMSLLPSANDFAAAYANSVFGSNDEFVAAVDDWRKRHDLESLRIFEPSGMDERNVANAADMVRIARLALADPTIAEFTSMESADMPWGIGRVENSNPLLGAMEGIVGLKTGSLSVVGFNLVAAQRGEASEREYTSIAVTLARPTRGDRVDSTRDVLNAMSKLPQELTVVEEGEVVGSVTTWQGQQIDLVAAGGAVSLLLPGETVSRTVKLHRLAAAPSKSPAGEITVTAPTEIEPVSIVTTAAIIEPDLWWRITHPGELLG